MKSYIKDYPRPQFVRTDWQNLNGIWDFAFDDKNRGEIDHWETAFPKQSQICVPFSYETKLSGIQDETIHENVWYQRSIDIDADKLMNNRLVIHFEGSDYETKVLINGKLAGSHKGGYSRFSQEVTNLVHAGQNILTVKVEDHPDQQQPRGKQRWQPYNFGCWYVQTTGIWKTVWMEYVPRDAIVGFKMTPDLQKSQLELNVNVDSKSFGPNLTLETEIHFAGILVNRTEMPVLTKQLTTEMNVFSTAVDEWGIKKWSPSRPDLYDVTFRLLLDGIICDTVNSYFGMRDIRIDNSNILLNGEPVYQRLILDQCYWQDSHMTPPNEEALTDDIDKIAALGYNGLRMHQKVEDERFLYWCDVKGMLVWCEAPSAYLFSDEAVYQFTQEWMEIVKQNYNHPSIITWTAFNESWGISQIKTDRSQQHFTEAIYHLTKAVDKNRPVIVNDGWEHTISDILTLHDYEENGKTLYNRYSNFTAKILSAEIYHCGSKSAFAHGYAYKGQPIMISEYGGIAFDNDASGWGYGNKVATKEDFLMRFDDITTSIKQLPFVCGYCYTQVTDVQQEINGLMDIDRNYKIDPEKIKEVNERNVGLWKQSLKDN